MKFIKNMFGLKDKKTVKYEANTLAETNGTPDFRAEDAVEKTAQVSVTKAANAKSTTKKASSATATKAKTSTEKTAEVKKSSVVSDKKADTSTGASTTKSTKKTTTTTATEVKNAELKTANKTTASTKSTPKKADAKPVSTASDSSVKAEAKAKSTTKAPATKAKSESQDTSKTAVSKKPTSKASATTGDTKKTEPKTATTKKATATKATTSEKSADSNPATPNDDADEITVSKSVRTGKFEIKKSKDGRFVFNLYASNNVIVATSQVYSSSTSAMNGIKSVIANAATAPIEDQTLKNVTTVPFPKWEIYQDKGDQYRFRLCASNGSCVCHSQGYTAKANCKKGIESIIKFSSDAEITKVYLEKKDK